MNMRKSFIYLFTAVFLFAGIGESFAKTLKASHQWPGTKRKDGKFDVRHEMVQIIADEMKKANVGVNIRIYPAKSLYKPKEQWKPFSVSFSLCCKVSSRVRYYINAWYGEKS